MSTSIDQIRPETLEMIEAQATGLGLSVDEYLRNLLPRHVEGTCSQGGRKWNFTCRT
ncbi:MAG: hypothetical protein QM785_06560 [Pyrinomonadaceae bacterium]